MRCAIGAELKVLCSKTFCGIRSLNFDFCSSGRSIAGPLDFFLFNSSKHAQNINFIII